MFEGLSVSINPDSSSLLKSDRMLLQLKRCLKSYVLPKYPSPVGMSKFTFVCMFKMRLCALPLSADRSSTVLMLLDSFINFVKFEIIDKQLQRERLKLAVKDDSLNDSEVVIEDSRLVAIARRIFPDTVDLIEQNVVARHKSNKIAERLIFSLKNYAPFDYLSTYAVSEHIFIHRLTAKLDCNYYGEGASDCSAAVINDLFNYIRPSVYNNKMHREQGFDNYNESSIIGVARSLFAKEINQVEKSAKQVYVLKLSRERKCGL